MAQYACMRELGWLTDQQIETYFPDGSDLKGLSDSWVPGLEVTSGSLGHGLSVGIAMGIQRLGTDQKVFAKVGYGEAYRLLDWSPQATALAGVAGMMKWTSDAIVGKALI
jgi:transketolase N-terminal domain/subunit